VDVDQHLGEHTMNQTIELNIGVAMDIRNIMSILQDRPAWVENIERELQVEKSLIDNALDHLRPAIDAALGE
jgi:predicted transcriptional regulator